mmetsp:Transcript_1350/g.2995  ORF Transcript_1350/g.2995 Transcript_1350/m.2995 type:complete len:83 (+) Transcript_1350:453-701(+)
MQSSLLELVIIETNRRIERRYHNSVSLALGTKPSLSNKKVPTSWVSVTTTERNKKNFLRIAAAVGHRTKCLVQVQVEYDILH